MDPNTLKLVSSEATMSPNARTTLLTMTSHLYRRAANLLVLYRYQNNNLIFSCTSIINNFSWKRGVYGLIGCTNNCGNHFYYLSQNQHSHCFKDLVLHIRCVYLSVFHCNQLVILTSSSPLSFVSCMKFESASSPSPLKGRPCHAKTFMFDKIFRKLCRHSNLLLVALADSDSAIYLRVVSSVIVLMTTSS